MTAPRLPERLERLFVFPLPEVHLFPHAVVPLHVFEPRYRALTRDALGSTKLVALPILLPGYEEQYDERPPVYPICGVGEIEQSHRYGDGRYDILVRGLARVRIVEELPPSQPYRLVSAVRLDSVDADAVGSALAQRALVALCDRLANLLPQGGDTLRTVARQEEDPGATADVVAAALATEAEDRQALLEELDVARRLERITEIVAVLVQRFEGLGGPGAN